VSGLVVFGYYCVRTNQAFINVHLFCDGQIVSTPLPTGQNRYRLIVSDGKNYINTFMPGKAVMETMMTGDGKVEKNDIVRVTEYALKEVNDKKTPGKTTRLVLATRMEPVQQMVERIGNPTDITKDQTAIRKRQVANNGSSSSGAVVKKQSSGAYDAIRSLNPYRNRWTIKARVTNRSDIKKWNNARGEGQLFTVDLLDAEGTEIRAKFWKEAVDLFYEMLSPGTIATFSGGKLGQANARFNTLKNEYELSFDRSASINPISEDDNTIKAMHFDFIKLADIENMELQSNVDIIGVVKDFQPVTSLTAKSSGRELFKRDLTVVDDSGVAVRLTLWGAEAQKDDATFGDNPVLVMKGARVGEFQGKNLSSGFGSTILYVFVFFCCLEVYSSTDLPHQTWFH